MKAGIRGATGAMALTLLTAAAAFGQAEDPRAGATVHLGPLNVTPAIAVKDLGVDTKVFNNADEKRDFTVTVAPDVKVSLPFARRAQLTGSIATDMVYYQKYASERSINPDVRMRGEIFLNRVRIFAEPAYLRTRQPMSIELDARAQREERGGHAGASIRVSRTVAIDLSARATRVRFDADEVFAGTALRETLNRESVTTSATIRHALTPMTTIVYAAERGSDRFSLSPVRDADSARVAAGVEFNPRALISGSASAGIRRFQPTSALLDRFEGLVMRAALEYAIADSTRFTFGADRDVDYSFEPLQPYFVIEGFNVTAEQRLVGRVDLAVGALRHQYRYEDLRTSEAPLADAGRVDTVHTWSASVGYRMARKTRIRLGVALRTRESNSARYRDYQGIRYTATTAYGF